MSEGKKRKDQIEIDQSLVFDRASKTKDFKSWKNGAENHVITE